MGKQLQHDTGPHDTGLHVTGPYVEQLCKRCGLRYSPETAYVSCFEEGDTHETWLARQHPEVQKVLAKQAGIQNAEAT